MTDDTQDAGGGRIEGLAPGERARDAAAALAATALPRNPAPLVGAYFEMNAMREEIAARLADIDGKMSSLGSTLREEYGVVLTAAPPIPPPPSALPARAAASAAAPPPADDENDRDPRRVTPAGEWMPPAPRAIEGEGRVDPATVAARADAGVSGTDPEAELSAIIAGRFGIVGGMLRSQEPVLALPVPPRGV